ncbi:MAG: hypothetical protein DRP71_11275 [Verrucomicrobia bacterium]|nr:MAG: hypothetical protein DRP71_11275 [Verrucomicrobiota bacterium]
MNRTKITTTLATSATSLFLAGVILATDLISMSTTHELAFGFLVIGVLGGLAISEYRRGAPRRVTGVGLRKFPMQHFRA